MLQAGQSAPGFTLPDADMELVKLPSLKAKSTLCCISILKMIHLAAQ